MSAEMRDVFTILLHGVKSHPIRCERAESKCHRRPTPLPGDCYVKCYSINPKEVKPDLS